MLIAKLIQSAPCLVEPYVDSILQVLVAKAQSKETSPGVAAKLLRAIGELAHVSGSEMVPYLDDLMLIVIETLQDQSSPNKREAALEMLSRIIANSGWVIEPYIKYPNLLTLLIQILKTEQNVQIRRHTVKAVGVLGALDPYRYKNTAIPGGAPLSDAADGFALMSLNPTSEEYYPAVAINALLKVLRDPSLSVHHTAVVTAIMFVFKTLSLKCVPFLPQILPPFLGIMRTCPPNILEFYFQQLGVLVTIVKQHIRGYINEFIQLIQDFWTLSTNIQSTALSLIEFISTALEGEFKVYLPTLLPMMLHIFETDATSKRLPSHRLIKALLFFGPILEDYLHLVIPAVIKVAERVDCPTSLREQAVLVMGLLSRKVCLTEESSQILHMLSRNLATESASLRTAVMETLCVLIYQLRDEYILFIPMINKVMVRSGNIRHDVYETLVAALLNNCILPTDLDLAADRLFGHTDGHDTQLLEVSTKKLPVNQQQLKKAWETSQRSTRDDWQEWIRRFSVELLRESPSHALRACADLAGTYYPLARELFNPAFVSCWGELYEQFQEELVKSLETALTSPNIPPETLQTLLHLAEFMEHDDKALPIDIRTLGMHAIKCHAYAKALHYKELEFISDSLDSTVEALISINHQLQQPDSAIGIITHARHNKTIELKEAWLEKLNRWDDGLVAYERKHAEEPDNSEALLGRMRCMHNLGEWEALADLAQEQWPCASFETRKAMAPLSAAAAWGLNHWGVMDEYIALMKQKSPDSAFFRAIVAMHRNNFGEMQALINDTRELLDTELTALVGESYNRAYNIVVRIQMLAELEEIIQYKQAFDQPDIQMFIRKTWTARIQGCQRNVESGNGFCVKSGRMNLSQRTLSGLLAEPMQEFINTPFDVNPPSVVYACLKHLWATGQREAAYVQMKEFTNGLIALNDEITDDIIPEILRSYLAATQCDRDCEYDTWLQVIPQLIARIHVPHPQVRRLIHQLLSDVGKEHPQALVYSLTVASKSHSVNRRKSALLILDKMRLHSASLVDQTHRDCILENTTLRACFRLLSRCTRCLNGGLKLREKYRLCRRLGRDLAEAYDWCKKYKRTLNADDLNQAWDLYYQVFKKITKQLPQLSTLELQHVSPKLLEAKDFDLAVPGSYVSGEPIVCIASFVPTLVIITSKQRPRRLNIKGSDGKECQFLLKGHEDLRQDERVMQLFGLVNTLLHTDAETFKRHLSIRRYPIVPLSPNSGLIGWVPHCDTLHSLIRDYRDSRKILLNIEHRLMLQVWLDRRTNYTRSLALMSMVGYILGLGDRHPSNLMLDRFTGTVIHIDFGDCFEVAINRDRYPERIPFRLTRMLINAMEVSGIEGNYRITCEHVMRVLRDNKDSLMAVLEAFVHDPLINWRLMTQTSPKQDVGKPNRQTRIEPDAPADGSRPMTLQMRKTHRHDLDSGSTDDQDHKPEILNARALTIINRVSNKLSGRDFKQTTPLLVPIQVQRLIVQATSLENLSQCFIGWCPFW
ncbi:hypothetical protein BASA61_006206 [Batrachochytrium salamandrivorans]|nr:hypothetical protein BASA61_006206 [Batrachochytrium salamandrivorans]